MIARHWRGWTKQEDAESYESLLRSKVFSQLRGISGYRGGYILRRDEGGTSEFVIVNLFESLDAVREFAGPDYVVAVFEPEAKRLLAKYDTVANHYEVRFAAANAAAEEGL